ncbi:MAG: riboflavin synthase [Candidatus Nephthysia bennettiae]|uniref:Riboflavin synthase n=1 Tax=Candidatus Nephthysia bennettiae TaxID=3127016 RepID=A0A934K369_9BACT|nr:riboflavin synthase [Candidatus Dormibacteraeota bacterium]MBJ7611086.1 riboflavin synthase [Candidatus Dormibacteraeota bacterium]PZR91253.1 MAG: riboflavin synthase [Candidatus Dormibacteraeota bacterium]
MFTGIVGALGRVLEERPGRLAVEERGIAGKVVPGSSVAINGVCLTVTERGGAVFFADVVPETTRRTNLGALAPGQLVNLELPLQAGAALDGHLVQGHVDATTTVESVKDVEFGRELEIGLPPKLAAYVAEKGSIAVDGTSLTVFGVDDARATFSVALIPYTLDHTIAGTYVRGTLVNLEVDVVARYVERLIGRRGLEGRRS